MAGKSYIGSPLNTAKGSLPRGTSAVGKTSGAVINNVSLPGPTAIGSQPKSVSGKQYISSPLVPKR